MAVELIRTSPAADPDGFTDATVCAWSSAAGGGAVVGTTASLVCNGGVAESGFYHLRVNLTSVPGSGRLVPRCRREPLRRRKRVGGALRSTSRSAWD